MIGMFRTPTPWTGGLQRDSYGAPTTYRLAAGWLRDCAEVADWGGGTGAFKAYLPSAVRYRVIDGTQQPGVDLCEDLELLGMAEARCEGIMLRHVLELNPDWELIVRKLLASFTRRAVIVTFTPPFSKIKSGWHFAPVPLDQLRAMVAGVLVHEEAPVTPDGEHVFYLERAS